MPKVLLFFLFLFQTNPIKDWPAMARSLLKRTQEGRTPKGDFSLSGPRKRRANAACDPRRGPPECPALLLKARGPKVVEAVVDVAAAPPGRSFRTTDAQFGHPLLLLDSVWSLVYRFGERRRGDATKPVATPQSQWRRDALIFVMRHISLVFIAR